MQLITSKWLIHYRDCCTRCDQLQSLRYSTRMCSTTHKTYVHPFHTWAVVTVQMTSPRCALIILPKAVITSPVRGRRPLSDKTSIKRKKEAGYVIKRNSRVLFLCITTGQPQVEKTVYSTLITAFKKINIVWDFIQLVLQYKLFT